MIDGNAENGIVLRGGSCNRVAGTDVLNKSDAGIYQRWCERRGQRPMIDARFGRDLNSAVPSIKKVRQPIAKGERKVGFYLGITLRTLGVVQEVMDLGTE